MKRILVIVIGVLGAGLCMGGKTIGRVDIEQINISTDLKELKAEFETFKEVTTHAK